MAPTTGGHFNLSFMHVNIYLDESGDTGWQFDQPYTRGGSSRYLVIAACIVSTSADHKPERVVRNLYKNRKWNSQKEKKWVHMSHDARLAFAKDAEKLVRTGADIELRAIVADKQSVKEHIRKDPNKLYNYMVKLLLIGSMAAQRNVTLIPDPRSIKVGSGNSLHDYLQTELWFSQGVQTVLETTPRDSRDCLNLQFTDMLSGVVHSYFEFKEPQHWQIIQDRIQLKKLFFD
jgi:hypothetical protein